VINLLTGNNAPTNCDAKGCTFKSKTVSTEHKGIQYEFTDTVGLNETESGSVAAPKSAKALLDLLMKSKDGYNLLIFVMKAGTILSHHSSNYKVFVENMTKRNIPILLVATYLENDNPEEWIKDNNQAFVDNGMKFNGMVGGTFAISKNDALEKIYSKLRSETKDRVWGKIQDHIKEHPVNFLGEDSMLEKCRRIWNNIIEFLGLKEYRWAKGNVEKFFTDIGYESKLARKYAAEFDSISE
jgi:GTPase Era involved in 16S rRNA processing